MNTEIHLNSVDDLAIEVSHFDDRGAPWCLVAFKSGGSRVKFYGNDEQLRDLADKILNAIRVTDGVCSNTDCVLLATSVVTVVNTRDQFTTRYDFCDYHATLVMSRSDGWNNIASVSRSEIK